MTDQAAPANVLGLVVGGIAGAVTGGALRRMGRQGEVTGSATGLVVAAAAYPLARRSRDSGGLGVEAATLAVATGLAVAAHRLGSPSARRALGAGWVGHAVFDLTRGASPDSRLPRWYPALCAGYDIGIGATLLR